MSSLENFDPNSTGNMSHNIFGLPTNPDDSQLILIPIPWEVTVSYGTGTSRASEHIFTASMQVDLMDADYGAAWRKGIHLLEADKKLLMKSDFLRKEAELLVRYLEDGKQLAENQFMCKSLREINEGSDYLNNWVYEKSKNYLDQNKLVGLVGGDHSTPLGYMKALAEKHNDFGILQIDAHCDLRKGYEDFTYSHASIMYNALNEIPNIKKLVQVGIRDYCEEEWNYIKDSQFRVATFFDKDIKERLYEGQTWRTIVNEIVDCLPQKVYLSFDIDGLDPKLCPNTGTPVAGGMEWEQVSYLLKQLHNAGKTVIGFDLSEVGCGSSEWDANVGARVLFKLCSLIIANNNR
jgi:agmatinase